MFLLYDYLKTVSLSVNQIQENFFMYGISKSLNLLPSRLYILILLQLPTLPL